MRAIVHLGDRRFEVEAAAGGVRVDGVFVPADLAPRTSSPVRSVLLEGRSLRLVPAWDGHGVWTLHLGGAHHLAEVVDPAEEAMRAARQARGPSSGPAPLKAPMPGLVVRVEVAVGDMVAEGGGVLIVEAMKMENELKAGRVARVKEILVREGETVERDQVLVVFEAAEPAP